MIAQDEELATKGEIGGREGIVEIDGCNIGRRKLKPERIIEGSSILGMIHTHHPENYRLEIFADNKGADQRTR